MSNCIWSMCVCIYVYMPIHLRSDFYASTTCCSNMCVVRGANANALILSFAATHVFFISPFVFLAFCVHTYICTYIHVSIDIYICMYAVLLVYIMLAPLCRFVCVTALVACSAYICGFYALAHKFR